uniref:Uncharacterized protein n=1 Tax=Strigamia maritima TaxID=126957 RepID=T1IYQ8_STRMM
MKPKLGKYASKYMKEPKLCEYICLSYLLFEVKKTQSTTEIYMLRSNKMRSRMRANRRFGRFGLRKMKKPSKPISTSVVMENHFDNYTFPTIVACPNQFIKIDLQLKMSKLKIPFDYKMWTTNDLKDAAYVQKCDEAINIDCIQSKFFGTPIDTVQGHCTKFVNKNVYRFTGTDSEQMLLMFPRMKNDSSAQTKSPKAKVYLPISLE